MGEQESFCKSYSTVDNISVLHSVVQFHLQRIKKGLGAAFVDFKEAFDTVKKETLLDMLYTYEI